MKIYIARGQNVWAASLDRDDAVLRWVSQARTLEGLSLATTTGHWTINGIDGSIMSDEEITQEALEVGDLLEMASRATSQASRVLQALGSYRDIRDRLGLAEDLIDDLVCTECPGLSKKIC